MLAPVDGPLAIAPGEVHVWLCFTDDADSPELAADYTALLDAGERERMGRFYFDVHRRAFVIAHALVRTTLSQYAAVDPAAWRFTAGERGKPAIEPVPGMPALDFNLSHTDGLVACAVSAGAAVGVDVERSRQLDDLERLVERFFSPPEIAALLALGAADRRQRFFTLWALKESYIKARGLGLAIPLDQFSFHVGGEQALRLAIEPEVGDDPARWQVARWWPSPDHSAAVCAAVASPLALRVRTVVPLRSAGPWYDDIACSQGGADD